MSKVGKSKHNVLSYKRHRSTLAESVTGRESLYATCEGFLQGMYIPSSRGRESRGKKPTSEARPPRRVFYGPGGGGGGGGDGGGPIKVIQST